MAPPSQPSCSLLHPPPSPCLSPTFIPSPGCRHHHFLFILGFQSLLSASLGFWPCKNRALPLSGGCLSNPEREERWLLRSLLSVLSTQGSARLLPRPLAHLWGGCLCVGRKKESEVTQLCPTLCDPMDCSLPGSSIHGIFQARILEWVANSFSRRSSRLRDWTRVSRIVARCFTF